MRRRNHLRGGLYLAAVLTMVVVWLGSGDELRSQGNTFTGRSVRVETDGISTTAREFDAGARTHWHRHSAQLLFVREGGLRYQVAGGPVTDIGLHETAYLPRGVLHWHGAVPGEALTHVSVTFPDAAGERLDIEWGDPVSDAEYGR